MTTYQAFVDNLRLKKVDTDIGRHHAQLILNRTKGLDGVTYHHTIERHIEPVFELNLANFSKLFQYDLLCGFYSPWPIKRMKLYYRKTIIYEYPSLGSVSLQDVNGYAMFGPLPCTLDLMKHGTIFIEFDGDVGSLTCIVATLHRDQATHLDRLVADNHTFSIFNDELRFTSSVLKTESAVSLRQTFY